MQRKERTDRIIQICNIAKKLYSDLEVKSYQIPAYSLPKKNNRNQNWFNFDWSLTPKKSHEMKMDLTGEIPHPPTAYPVYPVKSEKKPEKKRDFENYDANRVEGSNFFAAKGPQSPEEFETMLDNMLCHKDPAVKINHMICLGREDFDFFNYMMPIDPRVILNSTANNFGGSSYNYYNFDWGQYLPAEYKAQSRYYDDFKNSVQTTDFSSSTKEAEPGFDYDAFMQVDDIELKKYSVSIEILEENAVYTQSRLKVTFKNENRVEYIDVTKFDVDNGRWIKLYSGKNKTLEMEELLEITKEKLISLANLVKEKMVVVHCMNGRGRTGNLICQIEAFNHIKEILSTNDNQKIAENFINTLKRIRKTRRTLISQPEQFLMAVYNTLRLELHVMKKEKELQKQIEAQNQNQQMQIERVNPVIGFFPPAPKDSKTPAAANTLRI